MIVITGAAGFVASRLAARLNAERFFDLVLVDDFSRQDKEVNHRDLRCAARVDRKAFPEWLRANQDQVQFIFHLGARTDTTEKRTEIFDELNLHASQTIWQLCIEFGLPLVYASSAATYGDGAHGYRDDHASLPLLQPLNPYGQSKHDFDRWALAQPRAPYFWAGLKFFNVYGPHEGHKGRMASVVYHTYQRVQATGEMQLFRSHRPDFADGHQSRDFIYVEDIADVCLYLMHHRRPEHSGIYNLGSGKARTFLDLARATFRSMDLEPRISFVDTPEDIRDTYQYFTEADMRKLRSIGYDRPFTPLEQGIEEYVRGYLRKTSAPIA